MPEARIRDVNLHYDERGKGDPVLMIMGLGASSADISTKCLYTIGLFDIALGRNK